jgi:ankyrin repeat protein
MSTKSLNDQLADAAGIGDIDAAELLIHAGAEVNAVSSPDDNRTPLMRAVEYDHHEMISMLLNNGAQVDLDYVRQLEGIEGLIRLKPGSSSYPPFDHTATLKTVALIRSAAEAQSLATTLDAVRPAETVPEPPARVRLSNDPDPPPTGKRPQYEDLGAPDPQPIKPGRMRL